MRREVLDESHLGGKNTNVETHYCHDPSVLHATVKTVSIRFNLAECDLISQNISTATEYRHFTQSPPHSVISLAQCKYWSWNCMESPCLVICSFQLQERNALLLVQILRAKSRSYNREHGFLVLMCAILWHFTNKMAPLIVQWHWTITNQRSISTWLATSFVSF